MRVSALLGSIVLMSLSATLAAGGGDAAPDPSLGHALGRTAHAASERYTMLVRLTKPGLPLRLHIRGQASRTTISVHLKLGDIKRYGTTLRGTSGAALLDGPFLYEQAPNGIAVLGNIRWLRVRAAELSPASPALQALRAMTPAPLLRVVQEARMARAARAPSVFRGTVAYDDPVVRTALAKLAAHMEFRALRVSVYVGRDGLVHRLSLHGRTADGKTTFSISAHLFAFGRPIHVTPPAPGTFMDRHLDQLTA